MCYKVKYKPGHVFSIEGFKQIKRILKDDALLIVNFQGTLSHPVYSRGPLSIYKTMQEAGFYTNYFWKGKKNESEQELNLSSDIFFLGSLSQLDYTTLFANPRYNAWFPYDNFYYNRLIKDEPLDLSFGEVLVDDKPKLDLINASAIFNWRKNKIEQNIKAILDQGLPIY